MRPRGPRAAASGSPRSRGAAERAGDRRRTGSTAGLAALAAAPVAARRHGARQLRHALRARLGPRARARAARPTSTSRSRRRRTRSATLGGLILLRPLSIASAACTARRADRRRSCSRSSRSRALGWVVYRLGAAWFGRAAGVLAALDRAHARAGARLRRARLRRHPVRRARARRAAGRDAPPARGLAGARAARARRPAAAGGVAVLVRLRRVARSGDGTGASSSALGALAVAAPVLWVLSDLLVTGDPSASLTDTARHRARRSTASPACDDVPTSCRAGSARSCASRCSSPRRRRPARARVAARARAAGGRRRLRSRSPRSACSPPPACRSSAATCCCPPRSWRDLLRRRRVRLARAPPEDHRRRPWACVRRRRARRCSPSSSPTQVRPHRRPARRTAHPGQDPGRPARARARPPDAVGPRVLARRACPNHRPVPLLALWLGTWRRARSSSALQERAARARRSTSRPATARVGAQTTSSTRTTSGEAIGRVAPAGFNAASRGEPLVGAYINALVAPELSRPARDGKSGPCTPVEAGSAGAGPAGTAPAGGSRYACR